MDKAIPTGGAMAWVGPWHQAAQSWMGAAGLAEGPAKLGVWRSTRAMRYGMDFCEVITIALFDDDIYYDDDDGSSCVIVVII